MSEIYWKNNKFQLFRIGHDNQGESPDWYVKWVNVICPSHSYSDIFTLERFLAQDRGDKQIQCEAYPISQQGKSVISRASKSRYCWYRRYIGKQSDLRGRTVYFLHIPILGEICDLFLYGTGKQKLFCSPACRYMATWTLISGPFWLQNPWSR